VRATGAGSARAIARPAEQRLDAVCHVDVRLPVRLVTVVVLSAAVPYMLYAYRFVVFVVTAWTG
jgi:hypothetical protein